MSKLLPLCLVALSLACRPVKKGDDTETKSLDNVGKAPSEQTVNECGIAYTGKEPLSQAVRAYAAQRVDAEERYKNAVIGALTAVPPELLNPFAALNGRIVVTADAKALCKGTPFSEGERMMAGAISDVPACWKADPGKAPVIYFGKSTKLIRHDLVRMLGYFYTEFFIARISDPGAPAPFNDPSWKTAALAFSAERDAIAGHFLLDLEPKNKALHDRLAKVQATDAKSFGNYIFAEALDSYYCSAKARQAFRDGFPLTYQRFTDSGNSYSVVNHFGKR